jgi:hypothetical protein
MSERLEAYNGKVEDRQECFNAWLARVGSSVLSAAAWLGFWLAIGKRTLPLLYFCSLVYRVNSILAPTSPKPGRQYT